MSQNLINDMRDVLKKYNFNPADLTPARLEFRESLLKEEFNELFDAKNAEDYVDAHIDMIVIALGNLLLLGVDVEQAWNEVLRANMQKERGVKEGRPSDGWDLTKPQDWREPYHGDNDLTLINKLKQWR